MDLESILTPYLGAGLDKLTVFVTSAQHDGDLGSLDAKINLDEMGNNVGQHLTWTDTKPSGDLNGTTNNDHCSNWTSNTTIAQLGVPNAKNSAWTQGGNGACRSPHSLYCFEQSVTLADFLKRIEALEALHP